MSSFPSSPPLLLLKATFATNYTFNPLPIFIVINITSAMNNIESAMEIEEEIRNYGGLNFIRAPKKNHNAMEQIGKPLCNGSRSMGLDLRSTI
jgi:hypothetical protein